MNALFLGALLSCCALQDTPRSQAEALVAEGRYAEAWRVLDGERDPVRRARGQATVYLRAGDFSGELAAAEEGLTHAPEDQELLYFAAQASLWLRDDERADAYLDRLERSLERTPPAQGQLDAWRASVEQFRGSVGTLEEERLAREGAIARARLAALVALGGTLVGLVVLSVRAGPGVPSGTPAP